MSRRGPAEWNLLDERTMKNDGKPVQAPKPRGRPSSAAKKSVSSAASWEEVTDEQPKNRGGRPKTAWADRKDIAEAVAMKQQMDTAIAGVRNTAKRGGYRATDETLEDAVKLILEKAYRMDSSSALESMDEVYAEVGRLRAAEAMNNEAAFKRMQALKKDFDYDQCHVHVETSKQLVNAMRDAKGRGIVRLQGLLQICQEELNFQGSTDETIRPELRDLRIIGTTIPAFRESKLRRASSSAGSSQTMDEVEDDGYEIEDAAPPTKKARKAATPMST